MYGDIISVKCQVKKAVSVNGEDELRFLYASRTRSRGGFWLGIRQIAAIAAITTTGTGRGGGGGIIVGAAALRDYSMHALFAFLSWVVVLVG